MELGWTLILVLAAQLTNKQGEPHVLSVPLSTVWVGGAVALAVLWSVYSRLYAYVIAPLLIITKPLLDAAFIVLIVALGLVNLVLLPILIPWNRWAHSRWFSRYREQWIGNYLKLHKGTPREAAEEAFDRLSDEHKQAAVDQVQPDTAAVLIAGIRLGGLILTPAKSNVRIGLAPLVPVASPDGLSVAVSPAQQFGGAIANLGARWAEWPGSQYVEFYSLPALIAISSERPARFLRWLFHVDVLVWGRLDAENPSTGVIWITRQTPSAAEEPEVAGLDFQNSIFPKILGEDTAPFNVGGTTCLLSEPIDLHLLLLIAALVALEHRGGRKPPTGWANLTTWWQNRWDRLSTFGARRMAITIREHLAYDVLPLISKHLWHQTLNPSCSALAAEIVSAWAGHHLSGHYQVFGGWTYQDPWLQVGNRRFAEQLRSILTRCTELRPDQSLHRYRLGAVECILGHEREALHEFRLAIEHDRLSPGVQEIGASVLADFETGPMRVDDLSLARYAAHMACAIGVAEDSAIAELSEKVKGLKVSLEVSTVGKTVATVLDDLLGGPS